MTRIGSLCTGYGGLDMAVESVIGGELAWVADIDPGASAILAHRYPSVQNLHDLTAQDWAHAEPVDILTAGFPCQPVSLAGKRLGEADERWIWPDVARAVRDLRPGLVVLENVAALVARGLAGVSADLAAIGYVGSWRCIRASDVGAPHARNRVFITARPAADAECGQLQRRRIPGVLAGPQRPDPGAGDQWERDGHTAADSRAVAQDADSPASGERREPAPGQAPGGWPRADAGGPGGAPAAADTSREGLEVGPVEHHGPQLPAAERGRGDAPANATGDGRHQGRTEPAGLVGRPDAALGRDGLAANAASLRHGHARPQGERGIPAAAVAGSLADADGSGWWPEQGPVGRRGSGGLRTPGREPGDSPGGSPVGEILRILDWGAYAPAIARWEAVTGRPAPGPTEPGRTGERLSPRFVEWLMGLPDGWVTDVPGLTRNAQLKALGNGVVPQQAAAALRLLLPAVVERAA